MVIITEKKEPVRRSMLDVVQGNLQVAQRATYLHRIIYIGDNNFSLKNEQLQEVMRSVIGKVNLEYHEEPLTGIILEYSRYFCHIIEGCEEAIIKHLRLLYEKPHMEEMMGRAKVLMAIHHINQRFVTQWYDVGGVPPTLLEKIDPELDIGKTYQYVKYCIEKLYKMGMSLRQRTSTLTDTSSKDFDAKSEASKTPQKIPNVPSCSTGGTGSNFVTEICIRMSKDCLPEFALLEFLLSTPHIYNLQHYYTSYGLIPDIDEYSKMEWPLPYDQVPYNVFDLPVNPVPDLPNRHAKEEISKDFTN